MRSTLALRLALGFFLSCAPGCGEAPATGAGATSAASTGGEGAAVAGRVAHPFVWRVEGASGPSYLLGTIHVAVRLEQAIPSELADTIDGARVVVLEAEATAEAVTPELVARYAVIQSGPTLDQRLTPAQWSRLTTELGAVGVPAQALARMRSWLPAMTLLVTRTRALPGTASAVSADGQPMAMDQEILVGRRARNAPLRFLETPEDQLSMIAGIDEEPMAEWLGEMLDDPDETGSELEEMIAAYRAGDLDGIERTTFDAETVAKHPEYIDAMLTKRNRTWMPALREELARGGAFVAVGIGHFVGRGGLLELLSAAGLAPVRLPAAP